MSLSFENPLFNLETALKDGFYHFKDLIPKIHLTQLQTEINKISSIVQEKIKDLPRPLKTYSDIAERHLGRLDYRCGFTHEIFTQVAKPITDKVHQLSPFINFRHYWGVITALPNSGPTDIHRDVYPILNTAHGQNLCEYDLTLPPYYFTALIPLVEITTDNGPTEFIRGSHLTAKAVLEDGIKPLTSPGDVTIFDGRTLHRGLANNSQQERLVAYITFIANWYHDQTFVENNYLFPELNR